MGAIQQALNQAANTGLAAAGTAALAKGAKAAKSQAEFNAQMNAAELPVQEAENKLAAYKAEGAAEIEKLRINRDQQIGKAYDDIDAKYKEKEAKGDFSPDENLEAEKAYEQNEARKNIMKDYKGKARATYLTYEYSTEHARLSKNIALAQVEAKAAQNKLIRERVEKLGIGGNR